MKSAIPFLTLLLLLDPIAMRAEDKDPPLTEKERMELKAQADKLKKTYLELYRQGDFVDTLENANAELALRRKLADGQGDPDFAISLNNVGFLLQQKGEYAKALPYYEQALAMRKRIYKDKDHSAVAQSLSNLGTLLRKLRKFDKSLTHYEQALAMRKQIYNDLPHLKLAESLNYMGDLLKEMGRYENSLVYYEQALAMRKRLYKENDHKDVATSLNNVAFVLREIGQFERALLHFEEALAMRKRLLKKDDYPKLANNLHTIGLVLMKIAQYERALPYFEESLAMRKLLHRNQDHPALAYSLGHLAILMELLGRYERALPLVELALAMQERLHGHRDHSDVATSLNNIGFLLQMLGQYEKSLTYYEKALAMRKRLCDGADHSDVATSLNNLGSLLQTMGRYEKSLAYYEQSLTMNKRIYNDQDHSDIALGANNLGHLFLTLNRPKEAIQYYEHSIAMSKRLHKEQDHPDLASSISNEGEVLRKLGKFEESIKSQQQALAMRKRLFKDQDHPAISTSLRKLGDSFYLIGQHAKAVSSLEQALAMEYRLSANVIFTGGLADSLSHLQGVLQTRSAFLSVSRRIENEDARVYQSFWSRKALLSQLFRSRRILEHERASEELQTLLGNYRLVQRKLTGLLSQAAPVDGNPKRDAALTQLTREQQRLEHEISKCLPEQTNLVQLELKQLQATFTPQDVFLDFYRYFDSAAAPEKSTHHYAVFITTASGEPIRVELPGTAAELETAIDNWRTSLVEWEPGLAPTAQRDLERRARQYALKVRELLWAPLEPHLPKQCKRIYISPDGNLARVPIAAIPGQREESILLDDYVVATVESGPFLWEHLTRETSPKESAETLLVTGGVQYTPEGTTTKEFWKYLKGSEQEAHQVQQLWSKRGEVMVETGHKATTDWLLASLPAATYAHLATHGQFMSDEYARERQRLDQRIEQQIATLGSETSVDGFNRGVGVRNPLGYVGIVMAHANEPSADSPDLGIVSGTSLWPLDLSGMKLCVLSACETGLGQYTGGAGVQNLQLALHVAGCENVIASLWAVDDVATAALMSKFYYELWDRNQPPIEALRQAQLMVRNNPGLVDELSGKRGPIQFAKTVKIQPSQQPPKKSAKPIDQPKYLPAKYWAAFALSGVGQ